MSTRHYLDHASTSPLRREAADALRAWVEAASHADPGRQYEEGHRVRDAVEAARHDVATLLGVRAREIVFTSGGTEAANAANWGARASRGTEGPIAYARVEHAAVRHAAQRSGPTAELGVDGVGTLDLDGLANLLGRTTARPLLVHCQWANHEVGTVQPVAEVVAMCRHAGVLVHVDACAAAGHVPMDLGSLGADLVSLSGHKFGATPGVGVLVVRRGTRVEPLLLGGDQERARRAGMENVPGILGLGAVARALDRPGVIEAEAAEARARTELALQLASGVGGVETYGDLSNRVPHIVCIGVPDVEAEAVVIGLDRAGVAVHSGSACSSELFEPSPVLEAMGRDPRRSLRISVGWSSSDADVLAFGRHLPEVVDHLRALGSGRS